MSYCIRVLGREKYCKRCLNKRWYHLAGAVSFLDTGEAFRPFFPFLGALLLQVLLL